MIEACCPECGHILSASGNSCPFCRYHDGSITLKNHADFVRYNDNNLKDAVLMEDREPRLPAGHDEEPR